MATLSDMSTKELLRALRSNDKFDPDVTLVRVGMRLIAGGVEQYVFGSISDIRAELTTRPHIHNKHEGRVIRRIRSQTGLSEAQIRAIPKYQEELADVYYPSRRIMSAEQAKLVSKYYGQWFNRLFKVV